MLKTLFKRKKYENFYLKEENITNYICWYKVLEIFIFFFKKTYFDINKLKEGIFVIKTNLNTNDNLEYLMKKDNLNQIIFKKLQENNNCNYDLPFFELYIIELLKSLKSLNLSVMDLVYLDDNKYYPNLYKYYTFDKNFNHENIKHLLYDSYYKSYINDIENIENIDILIVTDYNYNEQLGNYYNNLRDYLLTTKYKLHVKHYFEKNKNISIFNYTNSKNNINYNLSYKLIACLLRNNKQDKYQKTILGFITEDKQYIINDSLINNIYEHFDWINNNNFNDKDFSIKDDIGNEYNYNFATGAKIMIYVIDKKITKKKFCDNINVIPQFTGTCWFNAILMASLYSEGSRNILLQKIRENEWGDNNSLERILKSIIIESNNGNNKKLKEIFEKIKPEQILLKLIYNKDKEFKVVYKKQLQEEYTFGWYINYIVKYLKHIGMKCLDIYYYNDENEYFVNFNDYLEININKQIIINEYEIKTELKELLEDEGPDYLILFHSSLYKLNKPYYLWKYKTTNNNVFKMDDYFDDNNLEEIKNYKDIIHFNGNEYKLDSCLLHNYNNKKGSHAIAGLTCNNKKYVYNGWNSKVTSISPCSLMPFDWDLNKDKNFCLNTKKCKLDKIKKDDFCFSFNKGDRLLIYTKIIKENNSKIDDKLSNISNISNMSSVINEIYDSNQYTKEDIINYLAKNHGYSKLLLRFKNTDELKKIFKKELRKHYNIKSLL